MTKNKKTVKTTAPAEEVAPAAEEVKVEIAEEKEVKSAPAKKTASKAAEKKEGQEKSANVYLQYAGKQHKVEEIVERAKAAAAEEAGLKRLSSIKTIDIYYKPEDNAAYYVANGGKVVGHIDL